MTDLQEEVAAYERLYSVVGRMLWAEGYPAWRKGMEDDEVGWPPERSAPWRVLEALLTVSGGAEAPRAGEPSDPARHLITRRAPGGEDRPFGFQEALEDWTTRIKNGPSYMDDRMMRPGCWVIIPSAWCWFCEFAVSELAGRLAPGRPPVTIGSEAARLSTLAQEAVAALRTPLDIPAPTSHAPWIARAPRVSDIPDLRVRLRELRAAAWRAVEVIPSPEELKADNDFSLTMDTAVAASDVRAILTGRPAPAWRDDPEEIDPSRHLVSRPFAADRSKRPTSFAEETDRWGTRLAESPAPWTPTEHQLPPDPDRGDTDRDLSVTRAGILAEILDELAARLRPGIHSGVIHYSAYDLARFLDRPFRFV